MMNLIIIKNIKAKYVLISYNNEGILTIKNIQNILSQRGIVTTFQCFYKKYKSQKNQEENLLQNMFTWLKLIIMKNILTRNLK